MKCSFNKREPIQEADGQEFPVTRKQLPPYTPEKESPICQYSGICRICSTQSDYDKRTVWMSASDNGVVQSICCTTHWTVTKI
jgi:hypothetical protein